MWHISTHNAFYVFKVVQHAVATNVALKIVCRRHVTRIDFLCNNIALKIVSFQYNFRSSYNSSLSIFILVACTCMIFLSNAK